MRRLTVFPVVLALLLTLPGAVGAARPDRFSDESTVLFCDALATNDGRTVFLFAEVSQEFGSFAGLAVWAMGADPFIDEPEAISGDSEVSLSADGIVLTATIDLWTFDPTTDPPLGTSLGTAAVMATLTPVGEPETFDERFKEGNRLIRASGTRQALSVEGELLLPDGATADLAGCAAEHTTQTFFATNPAQPPASFIFRSDAINLSCNWETDTGFVDLFAISDEFGTFSDLFVLVDETFVFGSTGEATLTTTSYSAAFELMTEEGAVVGSASAAATLTPTGERIRFMERFPEGSFKLMGELLSVDGELDLDLGAGTTLTMDDESCMAIDGKTMSHFVDPRGPKGKPLANDTPEGAIGLDIGESDRVVTGGNAFEPEAPCVIGEDPETGEPLLAPITFTAWWTFTGTGDDVTVSTAGSDFDTVLAVYRLDGEELVQVACVDDVFEPEFSLQAEATIGTDTGATYYIQAGGFDGSTGRLIVSVE